MSSTAVLSYVNERPVTITSTVLMEISSATVPEIQEGAWQMITVLEIYVAVT